MEEVKRRGKSFNSLTFLSSSSLNLGFQAHLFFFCIASVLNACSRKITDLQFFIMITRDPVQNTMIASLEEQYGGHQIGFER